MKRLPFLHVMLLLCLLDLPLLTGCHRGRIVQHAFRQEVEEGIPIARNTGGPKYPGQLFRCEELLVLQEDPSRPESLLYEAGRFCMDTDGRFYVLDRGNHRIAVFDPAGRYERSIGRQGQGPGEFVGNLLELNGLIDDLLVVYNADVRRITLYRTDGTLVDMKRSPVAGEVHYLPADDLFVALRLIGTFENDELWWGQRFESAAGSGERIGSAETPTVYVKYFVPWPGMTKNDGGLEYLPFTSEPTMAIDGNRGVVATIGNESVVYLYSFDGSIRKKIEIEMADLEVTPEDITAYLRDFDRWVDELDTGEERYRYKQRGLMVFPERRTFWRDIRVDDQGYIWLEVLEHDFERELRGGGYRFDVLSPEGEYLGRTELPAPGDVCRSRLLGLVADPATGAETCTVWRLVPAAEGFSYPR